MPLFTMPKWIETWNRKIHIYLGLYFLFFLGLFSISGLVLNHPQWAFAQFWSSRIETSSVHKIKTPTAQENQARAEELLAQLNMEGEIEQIGTPPENRLNIQVVRPGRTVNVSADFTTGQATVKEIEINGWGIMNALHQFNGVRLDDKGRTRDWLPTMLWTLSMDALCVGLIFWVLSSLYMWYRLNSKRFLGFTALGAGILCCGIFVFGLNWIG